MTTNPGAGGHHPRRWTAGSGVAEGENHGLRPDDEQLLLESLEELLDRECPESYIADLDRTHKRPTSFRGHARSRVRPRLPGGVRGTPCDAVTLMLLAERVAKQGLNNGYGIELLQAMDILEFGSEEQKAEILGLLAAGEVPFALGFTEPGAGSDNSAMTTSAVHHDGMVTFNGTKTLITNALDAKYLLLMAKSCDRGVRGSAQGHLDVPGADGCPGSATNPLEKIVWYTNDSSRDLPRRRHRARVLPGRAQGATASGS